MTDKLAVEIDSFRPLRSNTLIGFACILIPKLHLRIYDIAIHQKDGKRWIGLPARPQVAKDGTVRRDESGKIAYVRTLEFADRPTADAFAARLIAALLEHSPAAFDEEGVTP